MLPGVLAAGQSWGDDVGRTGGPGPDAPAEITKTLQAAAVQAGLVCGRRRDLRRCDVRPTREEILAEPAGRRLDAWVQQYVLGVEPREVSVAGGDDTVTVWVGNAALSDGIWNRVELLRHGAPPRYSEDIAAAWGVVEHLNRAGMWWEADGGRLGLPVRFRFSFGESVEAADLPLAVCRAALLATASGVSPGVSPRAPPPPAAG